MRVYRFRIAPEIATFSVAHATDGDWQSWQRLEEALKRLLADATGSYLCQMPTERLFCASATQCAYAREQLSAEIGDAVRVGPVHAGYRETVSGVASAEARYVHQTGCPGHFAIVMLRIEPLAGSDEILCENEIAPLQRNRRSIRRSTIRFPASGFLPSSRASSKPRIAVRSTAIPSPVPGSFSPVAAIIQWTRAPCPFR